MPRAHGLRCTVSASGTGVGDQFRIHYDPSHAILMGQDSRSVFQYLKDSGYNFLIGGFHVKGQVIDSRGISVWGLRWPDDAARGTGMGTGRAPIRPSSRTPGKKQDRVFAKHELPGTARP